MSFFRELIGHLRMNDKFEIDLRFGLSMQCIWSILLCGCYGVFYLIVGFYELLYLMAAMVLSSFAMLMYTLKGGRYKRGVTCTGISIQCALVHILVTYYLGNCGTVWLVISAMLIPHLYPLLKTRHMLVLDIMLLIAINYAFWISLNTTPKYADLIGDAYRFIISNISLVICMMELYVNIYSVHSLPVVRQRLLEDASKDACMDQLTGIGNRRMLSLHQAGLETDSDAPLSVAVIDIDFFKKVNDTYGHTWGDKALVYLAEVMKGFFRKSDLLIRWGGEEFLVLFRFTEIDNAGILMEQFRIKIQDSLLDLDGKQFHITVTIGLVEHCLGTSLSETIARADALMYLGKREGRNRVIVQQRPC